MFKELNNLEPFLENPSTKIHVRDYAKINKIAPATASKILNTFEKKNILTKEIVQNIHFFKLQNNQEVKDIKVFHTIRKIRKIIPELNEHFGKPNIILFGSASKGEDQEESDIDLYIESEVTSEISQEKLEKVLKKPIQLFVYAKISDVPNIHLQQNIMNGIGIQGEVTWIYSNAKKKE